MEVECILHSGASSDKKPVLFTEKTLENCRNLLKVRQECGLKYKEFILPEKVDFNEGFYIECYKRFIGLSKLQKKKLDKENL